MNQRDQGGRGLNELIFENRNRSYGAYALRRSYDKNIFKGMLITCAIFLIFGTGVTFFKNNPEIVNFIPGGLVDSMITIGPDDPTIITPPIIPTGGSKNTSTTYQPVDTFLTLDPKDTVTTFGPTGPGKDTTTVPSGPIFIGGGGGGNPPIDTVVREMPTILAKFNGDFLGYIKKNTVYPGLALRGEIEGVVFVNFVIDHDGSVSQMKVLNNPNGLLKKEALRVVGTSPKWEPAMENGKTVRSSMTVPIRFTIGK